jgi:tetratricopeptide (TPR) repeat protein
MRNICCVALLVLTSSAFAADEPQGAAPTATAKAPAPPVILQQRVPERMTNPAAVEMAKKAEELLQENKFRKATEAFGESLRIEENFQIRRRLAQVYFDRGEAMKAQLMPEIDAAIKEYNAALKGATRIAHYMVGEVETGNKNEYKVNQNDPRLVAAKKKFDELMRRAEDAFTNFDMALVAYGKILEISPSQRDFDAAGHQGLCYSVRGDRKYRALARQYLVPFLREYKAGNDQEQALYKRCETELKRINDEGDPDAKRPQ